MFEDRSTMYCSYHAKYVNAISGSDRLSTKDYQEVMGHLNNDDMCNVYRKELENDRKTRSFGFLVTFLSCNVVIGFTESIKSEGCRRVTVSTPLSFLPIALASAGSPVNNDESWCLDPEWSHLWQCVCTSLALELGLRDQIFSTEWVNREVEQPATSVGSLPSKRTHSSYVSQDNEPRWQSACVNIQRHKHIRVWTMLLFSHKISFVIARFQLSNVHVIYIIPFPFEELSYDRYYFQWLWPCSCFISWCYKATFLRIVCFRWSYPWPETEAAEAWRRRRSDQRN